MQPDKTILVNRSHPVPEGFRDTIELVTVRTEDLTFFLEAETYSAFLALKQALGDSGLPMDPISGYRRPARQQEIWDDFLREYGEDYTTSHVAKPGCSEHETGLAVDVVLYDRDGSAISDDYAPEYEIMFPRLHEYGFILRYPKGREAVTGYAYEPWHIRYVGVRAAEEIYRNHWTLEEYAEAQNRS